MKFKDCKIVFKNKTDKKEFLEMCKYIHDFGILFENKTKKWKISVMNNTKINSKKLSFKEDGRVLSGVSLDFDNDC